MRFDYGVYLLNKNIAQLRWHCDEPTPDLRPTLANLCSLLDSLTTREPEESVPAAARLVLPLAPAVLKGVAPVLSRGTPTRVHQQPQAVAGSPCDRQSDSESISSAKDSDNGDIPVADQGSCNDTGPSQTEKVTTELEEEEATAATSSVDDTGSILLGASNGLTSSFYGNVDEDGMEEAMFVEDTTVNDQTEPASCLTGISDEQSSMPSDPTLPLSDQAGEAVQPVVNGQEELTAPVSGRSGEEMEVGVAADLFWDSVTSRAQVLSVPTSFKISRQKPFSQY
jgi:hypothetical protein